MSKRKPPLSAVVEIDDFDCTVFPNEEVGRAEVGMDEPEVIGRFPVFRHLAKHLGLGGFEYSLELWRYLGGVPPVSEVGFRAHDAVLVPHDSLEPFGAVPREGARVQGRRHAADSLHRGSEAVFGRFLPIEKLEEHGVLLGAVGVGERAELVALEGRICPCNANRPLVGERVYPGKLAFD